MAAAGDVPNKKGHKKLKIEIPAFPNCQKNLLRDAMGALENDVAFGFNLLKFKNSNVDMSSSFSDCFIQVERSVDLHGKCHTAMQDVYDFTGVFETGIEFLKLYLNDPEKALSEDKDMRLALHRLIRTILTCLDIEKKLSKQMKPSETGWCICLVHHLLKELSVDQQYRIDAFYEDKTDECPCCKEPLVHGHYGDCSIGHSEVWHGRVDILLGPHPDVAVHVSDSDEADQDESLSSFEVEEYSDLLSASTKIIAETVVFAFLQKKKNPSLENFLVPTVGISRKHIVFYMYDPEHDFLLESAQFDIFQYERLSYPAVLALWLILNYKLFCTGITEAMRQSNFTADVLSRATSDIEFLYKDQLQFGDCAVGAKKQTAFIPRKGFGLQLRKSYPIKRPFKSFSNAP